jgi:diacylglycerol kinase
MNKRKQTILKAFSNAFNGLGYFFLLERNAKVQLAFATIVVVLAVGFGVSTTQWIAVLLCIAMVLCLEMVNTALEKICDVVQEEYHPVIKIVKDVAAGAVLLACIVATIIGGIIFLPKIFNGLC